MEFMNYSLKKLVKNLPENDFKYFTDEFGSKNLEFLKQKDAYPYEYMDSFNKFNEDKLPDKKCFYSSVKDGTTGENGKKLGGHKCDKDYLTCKKTWNELNMKNMGDYHDHYLKKDVLLLADDFEKFINTCLKLYGLNLCHYFSFPGLSCDVMLKMTGVKLEKISDINMYLFIEKGLKGWISCIAKRHSKANNKYIKNYDRTKPSKCIPYLDMNNLYGWAMSSNLSYGGFKCLIWYEFDINSVSEKTPVGYILEVNQEYPDELRVLHNDYSSAPEKPAIPYDMLSVYSKKIADECQIKVGDVKKLIPNLGKKSSVVLVLRNETD